MPCGAGSGIDGRHTMQILIVEDDVRLARALAHILEENGYGTDVVHKAPTGLPMPKATSTMWSSWTSCFPKWTVSR